MENHNFTMCTRPQLQPNLHLPETRPSLFLNLMQTEDNGRHLQTGSAQRWRRGWLGGGGMSSILRDKLPALPSAARPWSSRCDGRRTRRESVTRRP